MRKPLLIAAILYAASALAADPSPPNAAETAKRPTPTHTQTARGGAAPDAASPTAIPGLYEVLIGGQVLYLSEDGRFALQGDLLDLSTHDNLTENRRGELRGKAIEAVGENNMVVFAPDGPAKYTVTVFTDIDCGYCRKMHSQIATYNKEGIKMRYLMFPREGVGSDSFDKAVSVWCAGDRREARNQGNPVQAQYELGQKLGVRGTPSMILEDGTMIPGYVPPTQLAELLARNQDAKPAQP